MGGRQPTPKVIRELEGNRSRRPILPEVPATGEPEMPEGLCDVAEAHWRFVVGQVLTWGLCKQIDGAKLEMLARTWANWRRLQEALEDDYTDTALAAAVDKQAARWDRLSASFGMDPVARAKLAIQENKVDEMDQFLKVTG